MLASIDRNTFPLCVLNASAGSGKTFQLVLEYLSILLALESPNKYKGIVAITFTNKASSEMKTRIIDALFNIAKYNASGNDAKTASIIKELHKLLGIKELEIKKRASKSLKAILHGYEHFNVSTIDKFNLRLIKSFSNDLNLPAEFEISLNEKEVLDEVLELLLSNIGLEENKALTKLVKNYAKSNFKDGGQWNFKRHLLSFASSLNNEKNRSFIELLQTLSFDEKDFGVIFQELKQIEEAFVKVQKELIVCLTHLNLDSNELPGKSNTLKSLNKIANFSKFPIFKRGDSLLTKTFLKYCTEPGDTKAFTQELKQILLRLNAFYSENAQRHMLLSRYKGNFYNMALLKYVSEALKELRIKTKVIRISEFNELIGSLVQKEDAPYIYERFGTRYEHFLLDEFQDTSRLQWLNLLPLLRESLSNGKQNLIVGDPKQSIYRFNNGLAEQFVELPAVYNPENDIKIAEHSAYFAKMGIKKPLKMNYRSAPEIVHFNNDFFQQFSRNLPPAFERFYDAVFQDPVSNKPGFVRVVSEKRKQDSTEMIDELEGIVNQCLKDDFDLGDICILTDKNALGVQVANELTKRGITVFSQESLLISRNMEVRLLIAYLKWRMKPSVDLMKRQFAELYFRMHASIKDPYFSYIENVKTRKGKSIKVFDDTLFLKDYFGGAEAFFRPFENLVQLVQDFIRLMGWKEVSNPYLHQFCDLVFQFQCNRQSDLSKFIEYYEDNKSKFALKMPESSDAVQIMTIHKSKGLEFPVVIIPKIDFSLSIHNEAKFFVEADGKVLYTSLSKNNVLDEIHDKAIEEENLILLDKLNLLYVGLTRPEQRLYVFNRFDRSSNLGHLFHQNMATTFSISDDDGLLFYEAGTKNKKLNAVVGDGDFYIPKEVVNETSKFQIAFRKVQKERYTSQDERLFGVYFHALMGEIENSSEIDTTLSQLVDRGVVDMSMRTKIEATAKVFFQQGEAIGLLEGIQKVLNERPILLPSGKLFIPDKVMVRSNDIVVLDFKTGKKESKHEKQVRNYKKHLEEIFNQKVIPMLYYTQSNEFIQV
jgi:ATP-dependent exoDNAse (exonuclease V) beta subunit